MPLKVTPKRAKASGMPACAVGHRYWFEPVPTDVEVAPAGDLLVSTLTGATEAPASAASRASTGSTPARGQLTRGRHATSRERWAWPSRRDGDYLVSQLFGNEVSRVDASTGAREPLPRRAPAGCGRARRRASLRHLPGAGQQAGRQAAPLPPLTAVSRPAGTGTQAR